MLVIHLNDVYDGSRVFDEYSPTLHYVEGPRNVIAGTFSILSCQDDMSALVGKKPITDGSESASYSLFDDKEIFDCLVYLLCLTRKKQKQNNLRNVVEALIQIGIVVIITVIMTLIRISIVDIITVITMSLLINVTKISQKIW